MAKTQLMPVFDYSSLPAESKSKLIWYAGEINRQAGTHVKSGMEMGKCLAEARELCGSDKAFREWVERECGHSLRSAYNYIAAYENFGSCATVAQIELGAMYELAKNETAKKRALKLADKGVKVTQKLAKQLVADASEKVIEPDENKSETGTVQDAEEVGTTPEDEAHQSPGNGREELMGDEESSEKSPKEQLAEFFNKPDEPEPSTADTPPDYGSCPSCKGTKWTETDEGVNCSKCRHPHGEALGDADDDRLKTHRSKTIKTGEALLRCVDDQQEMKPFPEHSESVKLVKRVIEIAKGW